MRFSKLALVGLALTLAACARGPHPRHQHLIDDELVVSPAPAPVDYAAYTRVRLALDTPGGDLEAAKRDMEVLVRRGGHDPHLWTTLAELEHRLGDDEAAEAALARALELQPGYEPALALRDSWKSAPESGAM